MSDDTESEESAADKSAESVRKQFILDDDVPLRTAPASRDQVDRISDRINQLERTVEDNNRLGEEHSDRISEISGDIQDIQKEQQQIGDKVDIIEESIDEGFESVEGGLDTVAENAGVNLPSGVRKKVTLPVGLSLLAFSIISVYLATVNATIPLSAQITTAGTVGLIGFEVLDYASDD